MSDILDCALGYSARGWPVLPLHTVANGSCACGRESCRSPAKHPLLDNGRDGASTDPEVIRDWWGRWPQANIGVLTGSESGLLVLDVDYRHGGDETLADLVHEHGPLPNTPEVLTGNGRHLYFRWPDGAKSGSIAPGLDIRAAGAYAVAAPSLHVCGARYAWDAAAHPDDVPLADAPAWLKAGLSHPRERLDVGAVLASLEPGNRNDGFCRLTGLLHHAGLSPEDILLLLGPYAERCGFPPDELEDEVRGICARYDRETWEGITL